MTRPRRDDDPLIVTAHLDDASFARLDGLRRRHFPAQLNRVPAHISLFHHLPGAEADAVAADVSRRCRVRQPFDLAPNGVRFLGHGVALAYESPELAGLRGELARDWDRWLTPQDRQGFKAHVTIQNKVDTAAARALQAALAPEPTPPCRVTGVTVWRYLGGPWEVVATCPFTAPA